MKCTKCGRCCKEFDLWLDMDSLFNKPAIEAIKQTFIERNLAIKLKKINRIGFKVDGICENYDEKTGKCLIYKDRPEICRKFFCSQYT